MTYSLFEMLERIKLFSQARVCVIGDMAADVYIFGNPYKISREAPVIVMRHKGEIVIPGSAANSVNNLLALGATVYPVGVVGDDQEGNALVDYFKKMGVDNTGIFQSHAVKTISKMRVMAGDEHTSKQQIIRIDKDPGVAYQDLFEEQILSYLDSIEDDIDGVLVSDYDYGVVTEAIREKILAFNRKKIVVTDSHSRLREFRGINVLTPNEAEAHSATGEEDPYKMGKRLIEMVECEYVLLTRGNKGMILFGKDGSIDEIPIFGGHEVTDVTGAGDTVSSVMVLSLVCGAPTSQAARLSNYAASVVVMKRGTAVLSPSELEEAVLRDYREDC